MSVKREGTGVSAGIGFGRALIWQLPVARGDYETFSDDSVLQLKRFEQARATTLRSTQELRSKTARQFGDGEAAIFDAYALVLDDADELVHPVHEMIEKQRVTAEYATATRFGEITREFLAMNDEYMRQRGDDMEALKDQLLRILTGRLNTDLTHLDHPSVVVAHTLSPADIANLDLSRVEGVVCEIGGYTSHMAIIARTLGIPAVVGLAEAMGQVALGDRIALDGESGEVWFNPGSKETALLRARSEALAEVQERARSFHGLPTVTQDGHRVELSANVGQLEEVDGAVAADAESLGMYRTELLHIGRRTLPSEDEQLRTYRTVLEKMNGRAVTVRTYDDGGNRPTIPLKSHDELNPVLGFRGVRMSLSRPGLLRTQLRALLRASAYGPLKVQFPMVSVMEEVRQLTEAVAGVKAELAREGIPFDDKLPVGILVQTPAAALLAEPISHEVDFLSIAINDLIQFTLAIDRSNPKLANLYHAKHPVLLRLINWVVESAHARSIPCYLLGEAPDYRRVLPLFVGMGIDGFSINSAAVLMVRQQLSQLRYTKCQQLASKALMLNSAAEVEEMLP